MTMALNNLFALIFLASLVAAHLNKNYGREQRMKELKIAISISPPSVFNCSTFPTLTPSRGCQFPGFDAENLGIILKHMGVKNYSFFVFDESVTSTGDFENGSWTGVLGMIQNGTVDTICGGFQRTEIREQYFDFSYPILQIKPAFVVKRRAAEFTETAMAVFHVFSSKVWLTILAVLITQVVCLYCTDYVQLGHGQDADMGVWSPLDMSFYLFRMFIMQCNGALRHPTTTGKLLVLSFGLFDILLLGLYQGLLLAELLHPPEVKTFSSSVEMVRRITDKEFSLVTFYTGYWYFQHLKISNDEHFKAMRAALSKNPLVIADNATHALEMVATGNYILPLDTDSDMSYYARLRYCDLTVIYDGPPSQYRHYLFKKHSPWLRLFDDTTIDQQSFAMNMWEKYFGPMAIARDPDAKEARCPEKPKQVRPLSTTALTGLICLFIGGTLVALTFFTAEYIGWQLKKHRPELVIKQEIETLFAKNFIPSYNDTRLRAEDNYHFFFKRRKSY